MFSFSLIIIIPQLSCIFEASGIIITQEYCDYNYSVVVRKTTKVSITIEER